MTTDHMDVRCDNCGATNRSTSRYCARCGHSLDFTSEAEGAGVESQGGSGEERQGLELPWLQGIEERASKPPTEHLRDAPAAQPTQAPPPQEPSGATEAGSEPLHTSAPSPEASTTEPIDDVAASSHPSQAQDPEAIGSQPPDPNETPPDWVVGILEPEGSLPGPQQEYEPEELAHIMPWVYGEEGAGPQPVTDADSTAAGGLPPWLGDVTVQETLQSSSPSAVEEELEAVEIGIAGIEPFVPPVEFAPIEPAQQAPEETLDWLGAITGPEERAPVEPALRRADLSQVEVPVSEPGSVTSVGELPLREVQVRPPREGSVETLAALIAPIAPEATRWTVPGVERTLGTGVEARGKGRGMAWLLPDGLIYLLILAALLAVLLVRPPFGDLPAPRAEGVQEFYDAVERVGSSGVALVVYDWDASRSAEMSLLAEGVTRHLMSRRLRFVTMSTVPQGPGFAQLVTDRVRADYPGYEYGRDYSVLGYLPGGHTGLAALISNYRQTLPRDYRDGRYVFTNQPLFGDDRLENLSSYALIVTLASDEAELRSWIEQVGARGRVPMVAAVPQGLEPVARPYLDIPNSGLQAIVSGPAGALQYTKLMEQRGLAVGTATDVNTPTLTDRLNAQSIAALLVAGVILAALVGMGIRRRV